MGLKLTIINERTRYSYSYKEFNLLRKELASYFLKEGEQNYFDGNLTEVEEKKALNILAERTRRDGLWYLFYHCDCSGELSPEESKAILDDIESILAQTGSEKIGEALNALMYDLDKSRKTNKHILFN